MNEPFNVPPSELRHITMTQFYRVYMHPRNEKGQLDREPKNQGAWTSPQQDFYRFWRLRRVPDWLIAKKWERRIAEIKAMGNEV